MILVCFPVLEQYKALVLEQCENLDLEQSEIPVLEQRENLDLEWYKTLEDECFDLEQHESLEGSCSVLDQSDVSLLTDQMFLESE